MSPNGQSRRVYYIYRREKTTNGVGDKNTSTISKFDQDGFVIFVVVLVSRDFELGRNVSFSCEESNISPACG